jgi:hypothetical protein
MVAQRCPILGQPDFFGRGTAVGRVGVSILNPGEDGMKESIWCQHNVSKRDRAAIRRACELLDDPTPAHLALVEQSKAKRLLEARNACEERRKRREAATAQRTGQVQHIKNILPAALAEIVNARHS